MQKTVKSSKKPQGILHKAVTNRWLCTEVEMFHTNVFVCIGTREELLKTGQNALMKMNFEKEVVNDIGQSLAERMPDIYEHLNSGECFCVKTKESGTVHFIRLDQFEPGNGRDILTLSHECLHTALNILDCCGVQEVGNHECLCYLHELIFGAFLKELHKQPEK